jgi:hypothetical protein
MFESVRALLEGVVDYAGLFPPAALPMAEAVASYHRYRASGDGWMLGRFVVAAARLSEFETVLVSHPGPKMPVSVVAPDLAGSFPAVLAFNAHVRDAVIDSFETKAGTAAAIRNGAAASPSPRFTLWFEIPVEPDPAPLVDAIAAVNGRAKIRTGGTTEDLFPTPPQVARFIRRCDDAKVPFKATAGLHHAVPGVHPLTYESGSASCRMHGFLNLFLASAFLWTGVSDNDVRAMLAEDEPQFSFDSKGVHWHEFWISTEQIESARGRLAVSFGSCSFEEPAGHLRARGLI